MFELRVWEQSRVAGTGEEQPWTSSRPVLLRLCIQTKRIPPNGKISKQTKIPDLHILLPVANSLHPSAIPVYLPAGFDLFFFKQLGCLT